MIDRMTECTHLLDLYPPPPLHNICTHMRLRTHKHTHKCRGDGEVYGGGGQGGGTRGRGGGSCHSGVGSSPIITGELCRVPTPTPYCSPDCPCICPLTPPHPPPPLPPPPTGPSLWMEHTCVFATCLPVKGWRFLA